MHTMKKQMLQVLGPVNGIVVENVENIVKKIVGIIIYWETKKCPSRLVFDRRSWSVRNFGRRIPLTRTFGCADDRRLSGRVSDPNEKQAIGAGDQDEAQTPCCHPHLPDDMCVLYKGACTGYCGRAKRVVVVFGRSYGGGRGSRTVVGAAGRRGSRY